MAINKSTSVILTLNSLRKVSRPWTTNIFDWCYQNCENKYEMLSNGPGKNGFKMEFESEKDATLFALKWI